MSVVVYFVRPELPGQSFFRCERMLANLSVATCGSMWTASNGGDGDRVACLRCPIGASHAGQEQANLSPVRLGLICARCHTPSRRLIGGHRCVSCYNRERETLCGRNAKGTKPTKLTCLERRRVRFTAGGVPCTLTVQHSVDTDELIVATLRDTPNRVRFGLGTAMSPTVRQLRLF